MATSLQILWLGNLSDPNCIGNITAQNEFILKTSGFISEYYV
ncbi:hypothetical protein [Nostoc sp. C110]